MHPQRLVISLVTGVLLVAVAGAAQAAVKAYSVTSDNRQFCCSNFGPPIADNTHVATGYVRGLNDTKYGSISVEFPSQVINYYNTFSWYTGGATPPPPGFKYIKGTRSFANGVGLLKSGGGPGTFEFCPKAKGPGVGSCGAPGLATPASFNGRISVTAGAKQFGGTMQILAGPGGVGGTDQTIWRWIGGSATYPAAIIKNPIISSVVGAATPAKNAQIVYPQLFTKLVTHTPGSNVVTFQSFTQAALSENGAGGWTTGMVYVGVTSNGTPSTRTVMVTGYNNRAANGEGNIQVVSGLLFNTFNNIKNGSFPIGWQLKMTLPEPSPSLGLAAGSLAVLVIGLLRARRKQR